MRVLVTGGAGYIGSILVRDLLEKGYFVTVLDNFFYNQNSLLDCSFFKKLKIINGDVRDNKLISNLLKNTDIIIPLAALVGAPICKKFPKLSEEINYISMINILKIKSKNQRIIMPTSNSAYGSGDENNFCDEDSPLKPLSEYAVQKVRLEKELMERENTTSLRLATVFGVSPKIRLDLLVNDFTFRAWKDGFIVLYESYFKRNYIHVKDISRCFNFCIENSNTNNQIFNVGLSDTNISKLDLCNRIKKFIPNLNVIQSDFQKDPDQRNYIVSNKKIEAAGFKTNYSLEDGIKKTWEWLNK